MAAFNPTQCHVTECVHSCCIRTPANLCKCSRLCEVLIDTSKLLSEYCKLKFSILINLYPVHGSTDCVYLLNIAASPSLLIYSSPMLHCGSYSVDCHLW